MKVPAGRDGRMVPDGSMVSDERVGRSGRVGRGRVGGPRNRIRPDRLGLAEERRRCRLGSCESRLLRRHDQVPPGPWSGRMTDPQSPPLRRTPLTGVHERLGATLTGFAGWQMPLRYGSETAEHNAVRTAAGLFDLSHMGEIAVTGADAAAALDYALVGQPSALAPGRARYTMICAPDGGILDDLIVYRLADAEYLLIPNAANTAVVAAALHERAAGHDAKVTDQTAEYALIAIQGPHAARILAPLTEISLDGVKYYASHRGTVA